MNLIEKLGLEKCKQIVDGAPDWAKSYCIEAADYWNEEPKYRCCVDVSDLRAAIADHNKCQHEWNETTSNGDKYRFFVCKYCDSTRNFIPLDEDITDYVSDICNHIAPTTKVIEK